MDKHKACSVTSEPSQNSSRFISATEQLRGELHKSEVLLIVASTLLVVKVENIYRNTIKIHKTMETELSH